MTDIVTLFPSVDFLIRHTPLLKNLGTSCWSLLHQTMVELFSFMNIYIYWFIGLFAIKYTKQKKKNILTVMARKPKRSHWAYKEWAPSVK